MVARNNSRMRYLVRSAGVAALLTGAPWGGDTARAQDAAGGASSDIEQVMVPGSRIAAPGFQSANPVTEISPLEYDVKQDANLVDLMDDIPQLTINQLIASTADVGAASFSLLGLGGARTLVLVDGLRVEPTSVHGNYNINVLPASLIQRMSIVTGGASAAYGSDAVAGVVNITLNTTLEGLHTRLGYGTSAYGDDNTATLSAAWGSAFDGSRGHVVVGGDYFNQAGVKYQDSRPWGANSWGLIRNTACNTITTTCSEYLLSPNVVLSEATDGGVITAPAALKNIAFLSGGATTTFVTGADADTTHMIGGSGSTINQTQQLQPATARANLLAHADYQLDGDTLLWGQFLYARTSQSYATTINADNGDITITNQNPFIPASVLALMTADKITQFTMGRTNTDLGTQDFGRNLLHSINSDYDGSLGLKGKFSALSHDWSWDVAAQYSDNQFNITTGQNRIDANWANAVDAVANPAVGGVSGVATGQAVCRSTLTAPNNGCVPANVFGPNAISAAVRNYVTGTSWVDATLTMLDITANIHGEPFSTWAGPVAMATGAEYRRQASSSQTDAISQMGGWHVSNQLPYRGAYSAEDGYVEFGIPLARNAPLAVAMDLDAAARVTSYSNTGGVASWKIGLNYSPFEELRLRGTRSHDLHGPSTESLFQPGLTAVVNIVNPATGANGPVTTADAGNPKLAPEIGDTITAGMVYTPYWLEGFNASLDYWNIKVSDTFVRPSQQMVVSNCFAGQTAYCPAISYNSSGVIPRVATSLYNSGQVHTDGWNLEAAYRFAFADILPGWGDSMQLRLLATYVNHLTTTQLGSSVDEAGCVGACAIPRLRYNLSAIYLNDPWTVSLTGNWVGGGVYDQLDNGRYTAAEGGYTINNDAVAGRFYVNVTLMYQWSESWQLFVRANNLFNVDPPLVAETQFAQYSVGRSAPYDRIGLQWLAGLKLSID